VVAAAVVITVHPPLAVLGVPAAVAREHLLSQTLARLARLTRAAVAVVGRNKFRPLSPGQAAAQAAPASSSSNTTSALPQSSPSSHRKSGLHLRVR